jgi:4-hydroxybenzoyl-CoA thioesterase
LQVPIVDLKVRFLGPARWGDAIEIESRIERWGTSSFDVSHVIKNAATQAAIVEAKETRVCVAIVEGDTRKLKGCSIPEDLKKAFDEERGAARVSTELPVTIA